ncbi:hypothetical protein H4R27_005089 [Coemansia aciculifera]|nr:hypothetical protein H4R27_005089 [Coemansia aciculifera]
MSDSDSDDFFSDLRAMRRKFGLGDGPTLPPPSNAPSQSTAKATVARSIAAQTGFKRPVVPAQSPARAHKRRSLGAHERETKPASVVSTTGVSPAEIAALLSPRRQKQRTVGRTNSSGNLAEKHGISTASGFHIPPRTPESRAATPRPNPPPLTPTRSLSMASLASVTTPVTHRLDIRRKSRGKESPLPNSRFAIPAANSQSPSPDSTVFASRGLWGTATVSSPLHTPIRRQHLVLSPVGSSRRPFVPVARGLPIANGSPPVNSGSGLLGSVEDALVTDADIDVAKRKLGEEQAVTRQQIISDIRERMMKFSLSPSTAVTEYDGWHSWIDSVTILCQFYTLGHGKLTYGKEGVCWRGEALGPIAATAQTTATTFGNDLGIRVHSPAAPMTALLFPWARISGLRQKSIDDEEYVMLTADDDLGVAFRVGELASSASAIETLVRNMTAALSQSSLRTSIVQQVPATSSIQVASKNGNDADISTDEDLLDDQAIICSLLRKAAKRELRLVNRELARVLADQAFVDAAADILRNLTSQLATEALAALNRLNGEETVEDPGTETLPDACTVCYTDCNSVLLLPCEHKLCSGCFAHLQGLHISSSQDDKNKPSSLCVCPWDRSYVADWSKIAK